MQGFCIRFLSAAAVSSSLEWAEFDRNPSNFLRLDVCIGAVIDVEDQMRNSTGRSTALSVRWKTDFDMAYLEACLDNVPDVSSIRGVSIGSRGDKKWDTELRTGNEAIQSWEPGQGSQSRGFILG